MRANDVTASVAAALLGLHPKLTALGLYNIKTGIDSDPVNVEPVRSGGEGWWSISYPPAARGHLLEPFAMAECQRLTGWQMSYPLQHYWTSTRDSLGATPDAFAIAENLPGFGITQFKTVAPDVFDKQWVDPTTGDIVPPDWVLVQATQEAFLTGASWAAIAVIRLTYSLEVSVVLMPRSPALWHKLRKGATEFWAMVAAGTPPAIDWERDQRNVLSLYSDSDGTEVDLSDDDELAGILAERARLKAIEDAGNAAAKDRRSYDARIIAKLRNAATARAPGGALIKAPTTYRQPYSVAATSFRTVRVTGLRSLATDIPERF